MQAYHPEPMPQKTPSSTRRMRPHTISRVIATRVSLMFDVVEDLERSIRLIIFLQRLLSTE